ncbi:hypothetical protein LPJ62_004571 [Coemansia sp. RSA 2167]|nr:hypothetical protein LPJ62_004571 [Coemansia sp. RSA 2167]KAJ2144237.1 hypothetical protein IW142_003256 [Coemansia sp. RSA 564]KAJ2151117.1 hypothetical protein J3F82_003553 [Coemansia sp. RSA 637]KAJ2163363.1 hypothetical protein GGH15_004502 [Coemansia sp. RSA 562]KAJ2165030.1 hypothetical protein GGH16_004474 [Coemansia sp. RSA 560]KAJ2204133.1 hypothetical protein IW145_003629 [Coemansia sp. RSA 521]KAJ2219879.1 hypothetical protein IW143_002492 [Coemansia sp. RSA 520]KAJ2230844.1 hy
MKSLLMLLAILGLAIMAHAQQPSCREGYRQCQAQDKASPFYYRCGGGQWSLYTCGNGYTCNVGGGTGAACVPSAPPIRQPACIDGQRRCAGPGNDGIYYLCSGGAWKIYTCGNGYECKQTGPLQAVCSASAPQCQTGTQRCGGQWPGQYYSCDNGRWQQNSCNPGNRCVNIPGDLINCAVGK